jgi:transcriptional regulator with XRE-family HTH domain
VSKHCGRSLPIGRAIRDARNRRGMPQQVLADLSGKQRQALSRIESRNTMPDLRTLVAVADALGIDASQILQAAEMEARRAA